MTSEYLTGSDASDRTADDVETAPDAAMETSSDAANHAPSPVPEAANPAPSTVSEAVGPAPEPLLAGTAKEVTPARQPTCRPREECQTDHYMVAFTRRPHLLRSQRCPIPGCTMWVHSVAKHVLELHLLP